MPFEYQASVLGPLKQGELLHNVWEHQVAFPAEGPPDGHTLTTMPDVPSLLGSVNKTPVC